MKKMIKEYNARGERMYENIIKRENAKKNKYKEKDTKKRQKEWDLMRREINNKKWMIWV